MRGAFSLWWRAIGDRREQIQDSEFEEEKRQCTEAIEQSIKKGESPTS